MLQHLNVDMSLPLEELVDSQIIPRGSPAFPFLKRRDERTGNALWSTPPSYVAISSAQ